MNPTALPRPATIRARIHESAVSRVTRAYGVRRGPAAPGERRKRPALRRRRSRQAAAAFLRRERFIELTAGIVADDGHPLLTRRPALRDLFGYPWTDCDAPAFTVPAAVPPGGAEASLDPVLERLFRETGRPRADNPPRRRCRSPPEGGRALARPAPAGVARPDGRAPAKAAVHRLRPAALQGGLHRPPLGRGTRAVPGAGRNHARDRARA